MSILSYFLKPVAYLSVPAYLLHKASQQSPVARYYVRLSLYLSTLGLVSAWGVIASVGMSLFGQRFNVNWVVARSFYAVAGRALDISFVVEGEEYLDTRPAVLVGNHQSMLDILYLGRIFPMRASIMGKKELQWTPLLGQFMTLSGAIFVDRGNNARAVQSLRAAGDAMKARETSLWMFPEGTRSMRAQPDLLPFKKGAFHLAVQAGVPIVPVVCENYWRLYRKGVFESGVLKIKVLPPISTADLTTDDVPALAARVRELMLAALREISTPAPSAPAASTPEPLPRPTSPQDAPRTVVDERVPAVPAFASAPPSSSGVSEASSDGFRAGRATAGVPHARDASRESLASSSASERRKQESETGAETEEDEGMVLVGRPQAR